MGYRFNPPPNWPAPPPGWIPAPGWRPSPEWPAPPPGWQLWIDETAPASDPPTGYPPFGPPTRYPSRGQKGAPPFGNGVPQVPRRRRARRKRSRKLNAFLLFCAAIFAIAVTASALGNSNGNSPNPAAAVSSGHSVKASSRAGSQTSATSKAIAAAEKACEKRGFSSGDIYLRMIQPGEAPVAQQLGGEWQWDNTTDKCLTSVQFMIATAPRNAGNCTQVGYVADNPGYDVNATVAPPMTHVVAQAGPACQTATAPTLVQTTPAAAPAPPASTAPAGCSPLSNEGTCYEPGEYCRDADHGISGVAGDGEAITCEDNDGWRWEPA
jgi:hypothetical protein